MAAPRDDDTTPPDRPKIKTDPYGVRVSRDRDRQPPKHGPIAQTWDDITGRYEDEEARALARAKRPTNERIARLEQKHDKLESKLDKVDDKVDRIEVVTARIDARTEANEKAQAEVTSLLREQLRNKHDDERIKLTTTLDVGKHEAITRIDTQALAVQQRWKMILKIVGGLTSASVLGAVVAALIARGC